ncbi:hypothetical protein F7725_027570 [Dissostichus mawsoni]|uniref:Uncharacterized protein n=1 Tax=Dissostichus mawsoni TaxID=36200 RepID=A0A7J5XDA4_DISMA|nr:hypothetical protein F7725_027570 [Dissostichus mawsoni]
MKRRKELVCVEAAALHAPMCWGNRLSLYLLCPVGSVSLLNLRSRLFDEEGQEICGAEALDFRVLLVEEEEEVEDDAVLSMRGAGVLSGGDSEGVNVPPRPQQHVSSLGFSLEQQLCLQTGNSMHEDLAWKQVREDGTDSCRETHAHEELIQFNTTHLSHRADKALPQLTGLSIRSL